ncbi:MAG TPA: hypothetical protein VFU22_03635, partial [Roseiflexaceae bacterium]|nr:hypothetical protein [Roseiflexaceae bacterium]
IFASSYEWEQDRALALAPIAYTIFTLAALLYYYRYLRDLFMLATAALGMIVVVTAAGVNVADFRYEGYLVLSGLVIAQTAALVYGLRFVARRWEAIS